MKKILFLLIVISFSCELLNSSSEVQIETGTVSDLGYTSCKVEGEILDLGRGTVTQHGFAWSTTDRPVIEINSFNSLGATAENRTFSSNLADLLPNTTYYVRAYATNKSGTSDHVPFLVEILSVEVRF